MIKQIDSKMHTAEHILNQVMVRQFNCGRSVVAHIERKKSKCDYRFNRHLQDQEVANIAAAVNAVISADLPIREFNLNRSEAAEQFDIKRVPATAGEELRIIAIGDFDACPCSGIHAKSTAELGSFKIISTSFDGEMLRIRFKLERAHDD